ncbi:hypothetical protein Pelo_19687 [Pelomyxa schiedti]|nr:hypothetical protein Pelo_19687 [Pelomyxa schiedti]
MQGACTDLMREHNSKWMLMRGLEGDERFIQCPDVQSLLSPLLPQAQQAIVDLMVSKAASLSLAQQHITSAEVCIECEEKPPNVILHPCGHAVLCSECAATMRKCPQCRAPITQKQIKQL